MKQIKKNINNKDGIILASIAIVFAVVAIFTASVLSIVYSDNKFSIHDEKRTQAYYAARSAVEAVEQGIKTELKDLKEKEDALKNARDAFETNKTDDKFAAYMAARDDYEAQHNHITGNVIGGTKTHIVEIDGLNTDSSTDEYTVTVTPYMAGFRLEASISVDGVTSKAAKYMGSYLSEGSKVNITPHSLLENSLYAVEGITVGNNGDIYSEIYGSGDVSYYSGEKPVFTMHDGAEVIKRSNQPILPSPETLLTTSPYSYLPVTNVKAGDMFVPGTLSTDTKYTETATWDGDYIIDTTAGDVVLQFENVLIKNDYSFKIIGNNALIIYVTGTFTKDKPNAQVDMIFGLNTPGADDGEIYFMIGESGDSNIFEGKNNLWANKLFIYAPYTNLSFKNNFGGQGKSGLFEGLVLGNNIELKNNADIKYNKPSKFNIGVGDASIGSSATEQQLYNINGFDTGYWLKD